MILFKDFYKKYGVRDITKLSKPDLVNITDIEFPMNSILHFGLFDEESTLGPKLDEILISRIRGKRYIRHVLELESLFGKPRLKKSTTLSALKNYTRTTEGLDRVTTSIDHLERSSTVIYSYSALSDMYEYTGSKINTLHNWSNSIKTLISNINTSVSSNQRTHVIYIDSALSNKPLSWYTRVSKLKANRLMNELPGPYTYLALEIHKWINKINSLFDELSDEAIDNTAIMWRHGEKVAIPHLYMLKFLSTGGDEASTILFQQNISGKKLIKKQPSFINKAIPSLMETLYLSTHAGLLDSKAPTALLATTQLYKTDDNVDAVVTELNVPVDTDLLKKKSNKEILLEKVSTTNVKVTAATNNKFIKKIETSEQLRSPFDATQTIYEYSKVPKELTELQTTTLTDDDRGIPDSNMLKSTIKDYTRQYVKEVLPRHITSAISSVINAGVIVNKYEVNRTGNILGEFDIHEVTLEPVDGKKSTIRIRLPVVSEEGEYTTGGVTYSLKKQKADLPIKKISLNSVGLSSYYGKIFVGTSELSVDSVSTWIMNQILKNVYSDRPTMKVLPNDVFDKEAETPLEYAYMSSNFETITMNNGTFLSFKYDARSTLVGKSSLKSLEKKGSVVVGNYKNSSVITMDSEGILHRHDPKGDVLLGDLFEVLDLDASKSPTPLVSMRIFGKNIPVVYILGYLLGLNNLLKILKVKYTVTKPTARFKDPFIIDLRFSDVKIVVTEAPRYVIGILQGFAKYKKLTKFYEFKEFNKDDTTESPEGYSILLSNLGLASRFLVEFDLLNDMFIDPITGEVLNRMKEPETFIPLVIRATELLDKPHHPDNVDPEFMRIRGYERLSGIVYLELVKSIRAQRTTLNAGKKSIEMSPYAVWSSLLSDSSTAPVAEINPINSLKQQETVTFTGGGGRIKETLVADTRRYHANELGVISESVPDSGEVGVTSYMSASPELNNVYGTIDPRNTDTKNQASTFSTSYMLTPEASGDDKKRVNFISIQNGHLIPVKGAIPPLVRTGYEYVIPYRLKGLYALMAADDGEVTSVTKEGIVVTYKDGTNVGSQLGIVRGMSEGKAYPHNIVTHRKVGDKIKKGEYISYNSGFFQLDTVYPDRLIFKQGPTVTVAFVESDSTYEDSCAMSTRLAETMSTIKMEVKSERLEFSDNIRRLVKVGDKVNPGDPLFLVEDEITAGTFNESTIDTLKDITRGLPRSSSKGVIESIELLYHGEVSDMSPTIKDIATKYNNKLRRIAKINNEPYYSGDVGPGYLLRGTELALGECELKITTRVVKGIETGDKFVVAAQLKATIGELITEPVVLEDGREVDMYFSYKAALARIVNTATRVGIVTTILKTVAPKYLYSLYKK